MNNMFTGLPEVLRKPLSALYSRLNDLESDAERLQSDIADAVAEFEDLIPHLKAVLKQHQAGVTDPAVETKDQQP